MKPSRFLVKDCLYTLYTFCITFVYYFAHVLYNFFSSVVFQGKDSVFRKERMYYNGKVSI
jgi:hypothetical protein